MFGKILTKTAGTTFDGRQGKLWNVRKAADRGEPIVTMLRREPENPYDSNAIAVLVQAGRKGTVAKVGYVPANTAFWLAKKMDAGLVVRAFKGVVTGGSGKAKTLGFAFEICHEIPVAVEPNPVPEPETK